MLFVANRTEASIPCITSIIEINTIDTGPATQFPLGIVDIATIAPIEIIGMQQEMMRNSFVDFNLI